METFSSTIFYNLEMDVKNEIKSIIAKQATTLKQVCIDIEAVKNIKIQPNNLSNKFKRKTIKFSEVENILDVLGYHIEFIKNR